MPDSTISPLRQWPRAQSLQARKEDLCLCVRVRAFLTSICCTVVELVINTVWDVLCTFPYCFLSERFNFPIQVLVS